MRNRYLPIGLKNGFTGLLIIVFFELMQFTMVANAQEEPIKIAALYNLTGALSSLDGPSLNGAELAVEQINQQGGVIGRKIELLAIDTRTDQTETAKAAERALANGVVAGIGQSDTTFVMAAAPLFQESSIPFVTSGATHPDLPQWVGEYMFMASFGDDDQSYAIADYAFNDLGFKNFAIWTDQSMDFTKALSTFFIERIQSLGGEFALEDSFMIGDKDFSAQIARLKSMNPMPDAIFISAIPTEAGLTVKQIRESGLDIPILSGDGFDTDLLVETPGESNARNVWFSTHTFREDEREEVVNFVNAYNDKYGKLPENAFAALGFDTVRLVANAIERANSAEPDKIREMLAETQGFNGVTGEISYSRSSMVPPKPISVISVQNAQYKVESIWHPEQ